MEHLKIFQVDAFTDKLFHGNPAAVCLLDAWLNDELMQAIAVENNLSETAFVIDHEGQYHIRWFTPNREIDLCGHATLAAGCVLFELGLLDEKQVCFESKSGALAVSKEGDLYTLNFPALSFAPSLEHDKLAALINQPIIESHDSELDYLVELADEKAVAQAVVDLKALSMMSKRGLILTSRATECDIYSRCFYPKYQINEDSVTGSAHCVLTPYWLKKLNQPTLIAMQGSVRKGALNCSMRDDRVYLSGHCRWYMRGELFI